MTRDAAKAAEREQLDMMIALLPVRDVVDVIPGESPDFRIVLDEGKIVGVEIVRALNAVVASGAGTRMRLKAKIRTALRERGVPAIVGISFPTSLAGAMNARPDLVDSNAENIVKLACDLIPARRGEWVHIGTRFSDDPGSLESRGINWIERVSIARAEGDDAIVWIGGPGNIEQPDLVQEAIDDKAELLPTYARDVHAHWLLVVGSERTGGSLFVDQVEGRTFTSPFARTLFLELFQKKCVELVTRSAG
ncbi:MAG TPA: hypothetical protein VMJ10_23540 [Kofleriaceae bacterium]|nr:hypothetical protein [Kofleriaceae bacterium]